MSNTTHSTESAAGFVAMWNGTRDGQEAYVDYSTGATNLNELKLVQLNAEDMRHASNKPTLLKDGVQLLSLETAVSAEELLAGNTPEGKKMLEKRYFSEVREAIVELTGCTSVYPYACRTRTQNASIEQLKQSHLGLSSLPVVHVDRDHTTAPQRVIDALGAETARNIMGHKNWAQINIWRPIGNNVEQWPLLFVDHSDVPTWSYDSHTAPVHPRQDQRSGSIYQYSHDTVIKHDDKYRYRYASGMSPGEVLCFFSYHTDARKVAPHAAFWDNNTSADALSRSSIEVRSWVGFD